ncbi:MAG TPA: hypothetical protein DFH97_00325 [Clostridiales bacterium]|nr:hypothetical protein [Clostridiales bacterium]
MNLDTTILCNDYGIGAYKLWGATQPVWNSYYNLVEALKTQHPKVVVLEELCLSHDVEYYEYANAVKNTMGLRWSRNKVEAIFASYEPEDRLNAFFPLSQYHSRYAELTEEDFHSYFWDNRLSEHNTRDWNAVCPMPEPSETTDRQPVGEKQMTYLKKILYLCKKNNIPLLVMKAPYSAPEAEKARLNTVNDYLKEEGIPVLDCLTNFREYGFDYATDFGDTAGHLNSTGCAKLTAILGQYLKDNYDLPNRTGDPLFAYATPQDAEFILGKAFVGDGQTFFLDTGKTLYSGSRDYTIFVRFATRCDSNEKVLFSCFSETEPYRGLLVRLAEDGMLDVVVGSNYYTKLALPEKEWATLAITKSGNQYTFYLEGKQAGSAQSGCESYSGTLLLGCERMANNTLGRLSAVQIDRFELYDNAKSSAECLSWTAENRVNPSREQILEGWKGAYAGIEDYTLDVPFRGDGEACLDTGVQLYADPKADWHLTADLLLDDQDGTYLSCFNEEVDAYRGLLVRKSGNTLTVQVGGGAGFSTLVFDGTHNTLDIEKTGSSYTVSFGGTLLGRLDSPTQPYYGSLLVGGERDYDLEPFRQSALTVWSLTVE